MITIVLRFFLLFICAVYSVISFSESTLYPINSESTQYSTNKDNYTPPRPPLTKNISGFLTRNDLFTIGVIDSNQFGFIAEGKYLQSINDWNMFGLELDLGPNENRQGMTWGLWFTPDQKIKFTAERLAQNISFDFN